MREMTPRQREVYEYIKSFSKIPTVVAIANHFDCSLSTAHGYVRALEEKGIISHELNYVRGEDIASPEVPLQAGNGVYVKVQDGVEDFSSGEEVLIDKSLKSRYPWAENFIALRVRETMYLKAGIVAGDILIGAILDPEDQSPAANQTVIARTADEGYVICRCSEEFELCAVPECEVDAESLGSAEIEAVVISMVRNF